MTLSEHCRLHRLQEGDENMVINFAKMHPDVIMPSKRDEDGCLDHECFEQWKTYLTALDKGAMFDARVFNIPKEEVTNCVYWRQLDASRNSIQMVGQANFSHKELHCKTCNDIQDMLMLQKNINWNDFPTHQKRGTCVVRNKIVLESNGITETAMLRDTTKSENEWIIDTEMPLLKGEGREYIDRLVMVGN